MNPKDICKCGHTRHEHVLHYEAGFPCSVCNCLWFEENVAPAPCEKPACTNPHCVGGLIPLPRGMSDGFYAFMAGCKQDDDGTRRMLCPRCNSTSSAVVMDFPESWAFVRTTDPKDHHEKCSWRVTNGALLCDCQVLYDEYDRWKKRMES